MRLLLCILVLAAAGAGWLGGCGRTGLDDPIFLADGRGGAGGATGDGGSQPFDAAAPPDVRPDAAHVDAGADAGAKPHRCGNSQVFCAADQMCLPAYAGDESFQAGAVPVAVAAADLNHDGRVDLAVANYNSADVSVLINPGASGLWAPTNLPAGQYLNGVAAGDLDGDGNIDLVTLDGRTGSLLVLRGRGDGTFASGPTVATAQPIERFVLGDVDGDGHLDLAAITVEPGYAPVYRVSVLLGRGDETFRLPELTFAADGTLGLIAVTDLYGDGTGEVVAVDGSGNAVVMLRLMAGDSLQLAGRAPTTVAPYALAAGDLNNDGIVDLVAADQQAPRLDLMLGLGDGTFLSPRAFDGIAAMSAVAIGDVDHDGWTDVVVLSSSEIDVLLGNGQGDLQPPRTYAYGPFTSLALADVTGDGGLDIVCTADSSLGVSVLFSSASLVCR